MVVRSFSAPHDLQLATGARRARWLITNHRWRELGDSVHDRALKLWVSAIGPECLMNPARVAWLRASALAISKRAAEYDAHKSKAAW
eukprot:3224482-Karenia_brevis.AAC.1